MKEIKRKNPLTLVNIFKFFCFGFGRIFNCKHFILILFPIEEKKHELWFWGILYESLKRKKKIRNRTLTENQYNERKQ